VLAAGSEVWDSTHTFPPTFDDRKGGLKGFGYFNAGFFLLKPSLAAFDYYTSLLDIKDSFDPKYMEQNLLNFAHRWDGPMPWKEIAYTWNLRCPNENDFEQGLVSMHEKWWTQPYIYDNEKVKQWLRAQRWEMKGWFDAWDLGHTKAELKEKTVVKPEMVVKPEDKPVVKPE
jgi:alpha-N-acetylglucosamine transferase